MSYLELYESKKLNFRREPELFVKLRKAETRNYPFYARNKISDIQFLLLRVT